MLPRVVAPIVFMAILLFASVSTAQDGMLVYHARIIVAPEYQFNASDPWSALATGNIIATAIIEVRNGNVMLTEYTGDERYRSLIIDPLPQIINQPAPGRETSYYHIVIGGDEEAYRCGPAQVIVDPAGVFYYYNGKLLYGAIVSGPREARGQAFVIAITYTLVVDGEGFCGDPLVDGPDLAAVVAVSLAVAGGAAYSILRLRPRRSPVTPIVEY